MNKYARLDIACGIDMKISSAARYAAADIFAVVLKVHNKHGLACFFVSHAANPLIHMDSLVG